MNHSLDFLIACIKTNILTEIATFIIFVTLTTLLSSGNIFKDRRSDHVAKGQSTTSKHGTKSTSENICYHSLNSKIFRYGWSGLFIGIVMFIFGLIIG